MNLDTAEPTLPGQYKLTDESYYLLLSKLADRNFDMLTPDLKNNILEFYRNAPSMLATKRHKNDWLKLQDRLQRLARAPTVDPSLVNAGK